MKKTFNFIVAVLVATLALQAAQMPQGYYKAAEGKSQQELIKALCGIIQGHHDLGYGGLWEAYKTTDTDEEGYIIDMYSNCKYRPEDHTTGGKLGTSYNREHSFPQSWFGKSGIIKSDLFHVYPTDCAVNSQRNNYPYGECATGKTLTNGQWHGRGKLGTCTTTGYGGTVWEPDDEFKGDLARTYFYLATRYNTEIAGWKQNSQATYILAGNSYPVFQDWYVTMLLRWARQDKVSEKEKKRNDAVYDLQHNRNPYIDHPELIEYIWGDKKGMEWHENGTTEPYIYAPSNGSTIDMGTTAPGTTLSKDIKVQGNMLTQDLTVTIAGNGFKANVATIKATDAVAGTTLTITFSSDVNVEATGTLTIASDEAKSAVTLKAQAAKAIAPVVATPATSIDATQFTANWKANADVESYTLHVNTKPNSTLLRDDNKKALYSDWTTNKFIVKNEKDYLRLGTNNGNGQITSPNLDLTSSGGTATVVVTAKYFKNDEGTLMEVTLGNEKKQFELTADDAQYVAVLHGDASTNNHVTIANVLSRKRVMISNVKIYAGEHKADAPMQAPSQQGDETQRTITGITTNHYTVDKLTQYGTFIYRVEALYNDGTKSPLSNPIEVTLKDKSNLAGDINEDGTLDVNDVTALIGHILNIELRAVEKCDVDGNGTINVSDVSALIGLIKK